MSMRALAFAMAALIAFAPPARADRHAVRIVPIPRDDERLDRRVHAECERAVGGARDRCASSGARPASLGTTHLDLGANGNLPDAGAVGRRHATALDHRLAPGNPNPGLLR